MGKRSRRRSADGGGVPELAAPVIDYPLAGGGTLALRAALTLGARAEYATVLHGGLEREDAWQRAVELLFERLAVGWTVNDVPVSGQRDLLARYRVASADERRAVRDALREHVAEWFPDVEAP